MTPAGTITVLLNDELLTLGRACGVLRRRNLPIRGFAVDSNGPPGLWRLSCVIDADEATLNGLVLQIGNVIGVREATVNLTPTSKVAL
jgi:acetolactate synthase small subunit